MTGFGTIAPSAPWSTAPACPRATPDATRPSQAYASVMDCFAVLTAVAVVVGGGQLLSIGLVQALPNLSTLLDPGFVARTGPLLAAIAQLGLLALIVAFFTRDRWATVGVARPNLRVWHWVAIVVGLYVLKAALSIAILAAANGASSAAPDRLPTEGLAPFATIMKSNAWLVLLAGGILAAIVEELIYRGYLSRTLEASRLGFWAGALFASLIWAGLHVYYPLSLQIVLVGLGVALSWLRHRTGSVLPGMAWHIANNAVGLIAMRAMF